MKKIKVYETWRDFLKNRGLSHLKKGIEGVWEITIDELLEPEKEDYIHIIGGVYEECFVKDAPLRPLRSFWIFYINGVCRGTVYFTREEAQRSYEEAIKDIRFVR